MKNLINLRLLFSILFLSLCNFSAMGQIVQQTPMAQWHYTGYNTTVDKPIDWIYQVLPTDKREYIAVGYTARAGNGVVPVIMKLNSFGRPVWIKPITQLQEGAAFYTGNLNFAYFQQVVRTPKGYAAAGKGKNKMILVEVDEDGNLLNSQTAFTPGTSLGSAINSAAFCLTMNPAQTEFILGGQFQYATGGTEYACLTKIGYTSRSIISTKVYGGTFGSSSQTGGNNFYKLLVKPGAGSNYTIYAAGCRSMAGDNVANPDINSDGSTVTIWQRNKDMWLLKADQNLNSTWEKTFNKSSVSYSEPLYYSETGPFTARNMATSLNSAGYGLPAADLLKSSVNQDERAFDMTFTEDGKIALIGLVNHLAVYDYQYGNGSEIIQDGGGLYDKVRLDGMGNQYLFDEYTDGDAYLLKIDTASGSLIWSKNVSHFSSKDFYPQVYQQCGNYVMGGSTADYSTPYGSVDYFDALLVATLDNSTPGHIWRRAFHPADGNAPGAHKSENMCLFSLEPAADGGFVIGGDHNVTPGTYDDRFSITKFAPFSNAQQNFDIHPGNNDLFPPSTNTVTWSYQNYRIGARIVVPAGKTLNINNSNLHFAASDQVRDYSGFQPWDKNDFIGIAVEPGGRLNITNSVLMGAGEGFCDHYYMWDGIIVNGQPALAQTAANQGNLTIANSTIRDAIYGIAVSETNRDYVNQTFVHDGAASGEFQSLNAGSRYRVHGDGGGGRVAADRNTFLNCVYSVNHQRYPTPGLGLSASFSSSYYDNTFTSDATGIADKTYYHSANGGPRPSKSYIAVWAVDKIRVTDNDFNSDASFFPEDRPYGIVSGDGGFTITRTCSAVDMYGNCTDPSPGPGNTFTNLYSAVEVNYTPEYSSRSLMVTYNTFDNNFRSVSVSGSMNGLTANYNTFKLPELLVAPVGGQPQGITLAGCTGYSVQYNDLDKCATCGTGGLGIVVNTGVDYYDNTIRNNTMNNLYWGAVANQLNGGENFGLQYKCNIFQSGTSYGIMRSSTAVGFPTVPATMRRNQGDCGTASSPAGNQFLLGCTYSTTPRKLFSDAFVGQQVIYNANSASTVYDPGGCATSSYTVNNCNAPAGVACPGDYSGSAGYAEMRGMVDSLDEVLDTMSTGNDAFAQLSWERNILVSGLARWQGQNDNPDSAADLLLAYSRYSEALSFYLNAGNFSAAWAAWGNLPDTTDDQLDYIWLTDKTITLAQNSQGWQQLSTNYYNDLLDIAEKNSFSGFMAAGVADFLGLRPFVWPAPNTDTGAQQGARPGNFEDNSSSSFIGNNGRIVPLKTLTGHSVYPNPTTGAVIVSLPESGSLSLVNIHGQQVAAFELNKGENHLRMPSGISPGIYIGRLVFGTGKQVIIRIVYQP